MAVRNLRACHWALRIVLACVVAMDLLLAADLLAKFATSGLPGLKGYFQHIALTGVDITRIPPAEVDRIVKNSTLRICGSYILLLLITAALFWLQHVVGKKRRSSSPAQNPPGGTERFASDSPMR